MQSLATLCGFARARYAGESPDCRHTACEAGLPAGSHLGGET